MDDVLKIVVEEVALEGSEGCTLERLWTLVQVRLSDRDDTQDDDVGGPGSNDEEISGNGAITGVLDDYMKQYLWPYVVKLRGVQFFAREEIAPTSTSKQPKSSKKASKANKAGSSTKKAQQEAIEVGEPVSKDVLADTPLQQVMEQYHDRLHVVASEELRRDALYGVYDPTIKLSVPVVAVLTRIAKSRSVGCTQMDLSHALNIDPRSLFHYIKVLGEAKLIVKFPLVTSGTFTNLCVHNRFAHQNVSYQEYKRKTAEVTAAAGAEQPIPLEADVTAYKFTRHEEDPGYANKGRTGPSFHSELIKQRLTTLIASAKNNVMVIHDLMCALKIDMGNKYEKKWFHRVIESMVKRDFLERVNVPKKKDGFEIRGHDRCVRLLKKYTPLGTVNAGDNSPSLRTQVYRMKQQMADPERATIMGEGGVLADLPFEWQVYRLIALSGDKGVTAGILKQSLSNVGSRLLSKILSKVLKPADAPANAIGAMRVAEFVGRERRYRYYSSDAYNRMMGETKHAAELSLLEKMTATAPSELGRSPMAGRERPAKKRRVTLIAGAVSDQSPLLEDGSVERNSEPTSTEGQHAEVNPIKVPDAVHEVLCSVCHKDENDDKLLLCDHCNTGTHIYCLSPPMERVPEGDFFCSPECEENSRSSAFRPEAQDKAIIPEAISDNDMEVDEMRGEPAAAAELGPSTSTTSSKRTDHTAKTTPSGMPGTMKSGSNAYNRSSITAVRRQKNFLRLLEEKKVLEVGHMLIKAYQRLVASQEQGPATPVHTIDKKTIMRTAEAMEVDGLVKIYTLKVPMAVGGYSTRTLLLHPSLKPSDDVVQEYLAEVHDRHVIFGGKNKLAKVEVAPDLEVERLEDIQKRLMRESRRSCPTSPSPAHVSVYRGDTDDLDRSAAGETSAQESAVSEIEPSPMQLDDGPSHSLADGAGRPKKQPGRLDPDSDRFWLIIAQQYGYINAKMLRARYLHEWLHDQLLDRKDPSQRTPASISGGFYRNGGAFQVVILFRQLPFDLYLKLVGHTVISPDIDEFMRKPHYENVKIEDLPRAIRTEIFGPKMRYRRALIQILDILEALHIVTPISRAKHSDNSGEHRPGLPAFAEALPTAYRLESRIPLYDYVSNPRNLIRNYHIANLEGLKKYWFQLEFTCLHKDIVHTRRKKTNGEEHILESIPSGEGPIDLTADDLPFDHQDSKQGYLFKGQQALVLLSIVRNWRTTFPYSAQQKKALENYIDRKKGTTPLGNELLCRQLAEETGLSISRVKFYFQRAEDMHQEKLAYKQELMEKRKLAVALQRNTPSEQFAHHRSANEQSPVNFSSDSRLARGMNVTFQSQASSSVAKRQRTPRKVKQAPQRRGGKVYGRRSFRTADSLAVEQQPAPAIADEDLIEQDIIRRQRHTWTPDDDEVLFHGHAILCSRSKARLQWEPLRRLLLARGNTVAGNSRDICRRRIIVLTKSPTQKDRMNNLVALWPAIFQKAVAEGVLDAQEDVDAVDLDLTKMVEYFIKTMAPMSREQIDTTPLVLLPSTGKELEDIFELTTKPSQDIHPQTVLEEDLDVQTSVRSKMAVLYARPLTVSLAHVDELDYSVHQEPTAELIELNVVKALIKMILMTPENVYESGHAYYILHAYSHSAIGNALPQMNRDQVIVQTKGAQDRRVPGRGYMLSDKFLSTIAGVLPRRLVPQAASFQAKLIKDLAQGAVTYSPFAETGHMTALLDIIASRVVDMDAKFNDQFWKSKLVFDIFENPELGNFDVHLNQKRHRLLMPSLSSEATHEPGKRKADEALEGHAVKRSKNTAAQSTDDAFEATRGINRGYGETEEEVLSTAPIDNEEDRVWMRKLFSIVKDAGVMGISATNLHRNAALLGISDAAVAKYLHLFEKTLRLTKPPIPLVARVGFSDLRYVSYDHLAHWTISTKGLKFQHEQEHPKRELAIDFTPARMWYDIHGNISGPTRRGCMEAALGIIVQKPGVYESKLYRRLSAVMTRVELVEILDMLVERGACYRKHMLKPRPIKSLFDGLFSNQGEEAIYVECDETCMDPRKITCYWPKAEWYNKTLF